MCTLWVHRSLVRAERRGCACTPTTKISLFLMGQVHCTLAAMSDISDTLRHCFRFRNQPRNPESAKWICVPGRASARSRFGELAHSSSCLVPVNFIFTLRTSTGAYFVLLEKPVHPIKLWILRLLLLDRETILNVIDVLTRTAYSSSPTMSTDQ